MLGVDRVVPHGVYMPGARLFFLSIDAQAVLEPEVTGRNGVNFLQCTFPCQSLILVDGLFSLDGGRKREGEKKIKRREKLP
jgi:hypothetical protein